MELTKEDLDRIRALAQKATPGPWEYNEAFVLVRLPDDEELRALAAQHQGNNVINVNRAFGPDACKANAEYIATMHPGMATALVDEIERLRAENARLKKEADWLAKYGQGEQNCPYLALGWGDGRAEWCCCNDTDEDDYFECDEDPVECWLKAARKAVEAEER